MTDEEYRAIRARIAAGESERCACGDDKTRKAYRRYRVRAEKQEASGLVESIRSNPGVMGDDVDENVIRLRQIGFEAASRILERPAYIPVWREMMKAYCREFQEHRPGVSPQDYFDFIKEHFDPEEYAPKPDQTQGQEDSAPEGQEP